MDNFFRPIAESSTLQGIAVLFTLLTLTFYLSKYGWKSVVFTYNYLTGRNRKAFFSIAKISHRKAKRDYGDIRLILTSLSRYAAPMSFLAFQTFIILYGLSFISYTFFLIDINKITKIEHVVAALAGALAGAAFSSFFIYGILKPVISYAVYVRSVRQLIFREKIAKIEKALTQ